MIRFDFHDAQRAITNDQFAAVKDLIDEFGWGLNYGVVHGAGDWDGDHGDVIHLWVHHEGEANPTRHHISPGGIVFHHEDVDWDWKGTGAGA